MSIRCKILLFIGILVVLLLIVFYLGLRPMLLSHFAALEAQQAQQHLDTFQSLVAQELLDLNRIAGDLAIGNRTVGVPFDPDGGYLRQQLTPQTFSSLDLSVLLLVNANHQPIYAQMLDSDQQTLVPLSTSYQEQLLAPSSPLLRHPGQLSGTVGLVTLPECVLLVAARPVALNQATASPPGTIILGRCLAERHLQPLSRASGSGLSMRNYSELPANPVVHATLDLLFVPNSTRNQLSAPLLLDPQTIFAGQPSSATTFMHPLNDEMLAGYVLLYDIYGQPALVLTLDMPRTVYQQGQRITLLLWWILLAVSLTISLVVLVLIEYLLFRRLAQLSRNVVVLSAQPDMSGSLPGADGRRNVHDELCQLMHVVNSMLANLEETKQQLRQAQAEREQSVVVRTVEVAQSNARLQQQIDEAQQTERALQRHNTYLATLHEISLALIQRLDITDLLAAIVARVAHLMHTAHGYVYLVEPGQHVLELKVGIGLYSAYIGTRLQCGEGVGGHVWQTGEHLVVHNYDYWHGRSDHFSPGVIYATIGVPLISAQQVVGVIGVAYVEQECEFGATEVDLLQRFAQLSAIALDNAHLYAAVQHELERRNTIEEALRRSRSDYASIFANAPHGIFQAAPDGHLLRANLALACICGYNAPEALIAAVTNVEQQLYADSDQRQRFHTLINEYGFVSGLESQIYRQDGSVIWIAESTRAVYDAQDRLLYYEGFVQDITERKRAEEVQVKEERYALAAQVGGIGVWEWHLETDDLYMAPGLKTLLGLPGDEQRNWFKARDILTTLGTSDTVLMTMQSHLDQVSPYYEFEQSIHYASGATRWFLFRGAAIREAQGQVRRLIGVATDITSRKLAEELQVREERYALAARGANDGLWDWNLTNNDLYLSTRWKAMLGWEDADIGSNPDEWFNRVHPSDFEPLHVAITRHLQRQTNHFEHEYRMQHRDGAYLWMLCRGLAVWDADGNPIRIAGSQTDITERKLVERQLLQTSLHDALTGLPNRALLIDRLEHAIERSKRYTSHQFAVLFLDCDHFKTVNDSLGHLLGDQLLVVVAQRLLECLRSGDTVARFGGDEFALLLEDISGDDQAIAITDRILWAFTTPFELNGRDVFMAVSIGVVLNANCYHQATDLLRDADTALYQAKAQGRGQYVIFDATMHTRIVTRMELATDLRRAIERHELSVYYQPIVDLATYTIVGFEALVRWQHPQRGWLLPNEFLSIAEECGLMLPINQWVLHTACQQTYLWQQSLPSVPPLFVCVNLSARQLGHFDLVNQVQQVLHTTGLDPASLKLEITEDSMIEQPQVAITILTRLHDMHIQISLDDFGTGYSSLSYLHRFPINILKIDRSFVHGMHANAQNTEIVRSIVTLAHNLGMEVVAEGIESQQHMQQLQALRCNYGQGFFFSKAVDNVVATELLKSGIRALER